MQKVAIKSLPIENVLQKESTDDKFCESPFSSPGTIPNNKHEETEQCKLNRFPFSLRSE